MAANDSSVSCVIVLAYNAFTCDAGRSVATTASRSLSYRYASTVGMTSTVGSWYSTSQFARFRVKRHRGDGTDAVRHRQARQHRIHVGRDCDRVAGAVACAQITRRRVRQFRQSVSEQTGECLDSGFDSRVLGRSPGPPSRRDGRYRASRTTPSGHRLCCHSRRRASSAAALALASAARIAV